MSKKIDEAKAEKRNDDGYNLAIKNDVIFKAVFGRDNEDCKTLLIYLLNLILKREKDPIVDIEYKNPFEIREYVDDKETILDIKVTTNSGEIIDLEIQLISSDYLTRRMVRYHAGLIHDSLKKGEPYGKMKETISIWIVDDVIFDATNNFFSEFYFIEKEKGFMLDTITRICCIELPKVNRGNCLVRDLTPLEICLEFIKCARESSSHYVDSLMEAGGKELYMAYEMLKKATADEILREKAIAREKFQMDVFSAIEDAKMLAEEKGRTEGRAEGDAEGQRKKSLEIASKLKAMGLSVEQIAEGTGLTKDQIETL